MGRITGSWERPIQGVSQQADRDRLDGQCTKQENFIPSPLYGLTKRIGTRHVERLMDDVSPDALWYEYDRGTSERYLVLIEPMSYPRVFDLGGVERTVNVVGSVSDSYLKVTKPKDLLRLKTIADYTFIANNSEVVGVSPDVAPDNPNTAIVYLQFATYGRDYIINIDGVERARYTTPDGSTASHIDQIKTDFVATQLSSYLTGTTLIGETLTAQFSGTVGSNTYVTTSNNISKVISVTRSDGTEVSYSSFSGNTLEFDTGATVPVGTQLFVRYYYPSGTTELVVEQFANCLFVSKQDNSSFTISTSDSSDGNDLIAVQDKVKQVSNLPPYAPDGYVVKIQNQEGYDANAFWLKAEPKDEEQTGSTVRWVEALATGEKIRFDLLTMPHQLVSLGDGTFELSVGEWEDRRVGNEDTNPFPSFVGSTIRSIGSFQNRMFFTSAEAAIFGKSNNFFDFFRETTQEATPDDPIDAFADADEINNLEHYAILDGDIVFFAENGQFLIDGSKPITKDSLIFRKVTSYPMNIKAAPAVTGESIMFSFLSGKYAGVREMFTDSYTDTKRARPITEHVAEYIQGTPTSLTTSPNINLMLIGTDADASVVYAYDWLWVGDNRAQAAFHKWVFEGDVLYTKFVSDRIYFVIDRGYGIFLEQIPISNDEDDDGLDFAVRLDQRYVVNATWTGQRWEWSVPFDTNLDKLEFVRGSGCWEADRGTSVIYENEGLDFWSYDDLADTASGVTTCNLTMGTKYTSKFIPTRPSIKDQSGSVMGLDRFTLGKVTLNYESIGDILVYVTDLYSESRRWQYEFNGRRLGSWTNRVGFSPLAAGKFSFPVRLQSQQAQIEIITDDYRPLVLRDMEWEGMFRQRGRRI